MDDNHPIFLPGDDPVDFCRLLYIFYREYVRFYHLRHQLTEVNKVTL